MSVARYFVKEGGHVAAGEPIVLLENHWARFELVADVPAVVARNLYDWAPGIQLPVGAEVALLAFDEADLRDRKPLISMRIATVLRSKRDPKMGL
jgi:pyruvate/2-oxoglutarate dehydrogenase complex dihydrolipoamide acyltransferase (E2) component